jgi:hypothetical protein
MQEFDTLKIQVPAQSVRGGRSDIWVKTQKAHTGTGQIIETEQIDSSALPVGVSQFSTAKGGVDYQITFSAKILGQDYLKGLNINNWDRVFDIIKPVIDIDKNIVFDNSKVFTCDTTNNLQIEDIGFKHSQIYSALLSGRANMRFMPVSYQTRKKQGIEFRGTQEEKNRMIVYSKHLDLYKPQNKAFLSLVNASELIRESEKQIRFEVNHTTLRSIRNRFNIENNSLKSVLESKAPVNHNFLKKIMNVTDIKQTTLFSEWEEFEQQGGAGFDFLCLKGIQSVIKDLQCSDVLVKNMFQNLFKSEDLFKYHWYKKKNSVRSILQSEQMKKFGIQTETADLIINRVLENLYKAVA